MPAGDGFPAPLPFQAPEVWLVDLAKCAPALLDADCRLRLLPADFEADGERRLAHVALRILLMRAGVDAANAPFGTGRFGKPQVATGEEFSLAHTAGFALVGLGGNAQIGVDLERRARGLRMSPVRAQRVRAAGGWVAACCRREHAKPLAPSDAGTLQAWVRLEAVAKADGIGVGRLLAEFGVLGRPGPAEEIFLPDRFSRYSVRDLDLGEIVIGAVATTGQADAMSVHLMPEAVQSMAGIIGRGDAVRRKCD